MICEGLGAFFIRKMEKLKISLKGVNQLQLLGAQDEYLHLIEDAFKSKLVVRGDEVIVTGEKETADELRRLFTETIISTKKMF
jgi:phosphate starvation-inducible protein PhoH